MSVSKLESLPNEILSDIIEKYINGVDVLMVFSYQLNRRFDALIAQCHRLDFNFIGCQKDAFRFCMGLLPAYIDKIEELVISECDTPGQVYAFLSFFPSFRPFKRLRKLYFYYNNETVNPNMVVRAFNSLSGTTIDTLSIEIMNSKNDILWNKIIVDVLGLKTLKQFCFVSDRYSINWNSLTNISSNIEYLSVSGSPCNFQDLGTIGQWAPRLKYLDVQIINRTYYPFDESKQSSEKNIIPMFALRTLILSFEERDSITLDMLAPHLKAMPVLNRLEIKGNRKYLDADVLEMLLETSLRLLTHLTFLATISSSQDVDIRNLRASFQSSFWVSKKNFNIIIVDHKGFDLSESDIYARRHGHYAFIPPVSQCWIAPDRTVNDSFITVNKITSLGLLDRSDIKLRHYYFNNVKCLSVDSMNRSLFKWLTTYVDCSRITELIIKPSNEKTDEFVSLLACVPNTNSLYISCDLLMASKDALVEKNKCLKRLDISVIEHGFDEKTIIIIGKLFPYLEHIQIKTRDIYNVPILKFYLPHLRSLTFHIETDFETFSYFDDDYAKQKQAYELRRKTEFLFEHEKNWLTVWIDQATYEESSWQKFVVNLPQSTVKFIPTRASSSSTTMTASNNPTTTASSDDKKKKKRKFSLLKFFKK